MSDNSRANFNHKAVLGFTIVQLVAGCIGIVIGICAIFYSSIGFVGTGIWCGLIFIVTSIFGFTSWKFKNNCNIIALMVLCIISAVFAFTGFITQISAVLIDIQSHHYITFRYEIALGLDSFMLIAFFVEFIISIVCSAFCCRAVCCGQRSPAGQVVVYAQVQPNQQQQVIIPTSGFGGQPMGPVYDPVASPAYVGSQNPTLTVVSAQYVENTNNSTVEQGSQQDEGFGYNRLNDK